MLNIKLALKFIFRKPIQTIITITIITIGVAIFYFIYNASGGLKKVVLNATAETGSHIYIKGDFKFASYDDQEVSEFRKTLKHKDSRIKDISYSLTLPSEANRLQRNYHLPIMLKGIDFEEGGEIQKITSRIKNDKVNNIPSNDSSINYFGEIAIGEGLAKNLGFADPKNAIGKPIKIDVLIGKNEKETLIFKVVAVYFSSYLELSNNMAFTTIETLHKLPLYKDKTNLIEIKTNNPLISDQVEHTIYDYVKETYASSTITNWQEGNGYIVNALYIEDTSLLIIQVFTAISIAFGLASIITFSVRSKYNQIGILKAMGLKNSKVRMIFLIQVLIFLVIGSYLGLLLGDFISKYFMIVFRRPNSNNPLVPLLLGINNSYSLVTILVMFSSSLIATLVPVRMAEKLKIIEVIKNE